MGGQSRAFRGAAPLAIGLVLALFSGTALAGFAADPVIQRPGYQDLPFANGTYTVFTSDQGHRFSYDVIAIGGLLKDLKLNRNRTDGFAGNFDAGTDTVIFQQARGGNSDIFTYDLPNGPRQPVSEINTGRWEFSPRISNSFILYTVNVARHGRQYDRVVLFDRSDLSKTKLGTFRSEHGYAYSTFVGESFASYTVCNRTCHVFVYDIAGDSTARLPGADRRHPQYTGWIDEATSTLYFVRSGNGCGKNATLAYTQANNLSVPAVKIFTLPDGFDVDGAISLAPGAVGNDLYFPEIDCGTFKADIFAIRNVPSIP